MSENDMEEEMLDIIRAENARMKDELASLRQLIMFTEPSVMLDGRFEKMMLAPINVIEVARNLIEQIPQNSNKSY